MNSTWKVYASLPESLSDKGLFREWLTGETSALGIQWDSMLTADGPHLEGQAAPFFGNLSASGEKSSWYQELQAAMPNDHDRECMVRNVALLQEGKARVLVTGQQPGSLGGPLYTLFKVATAVAAASRLSKSGQPTIALFWSGDDDDDLVEAMSTVGWDQEQRALFANDQGQATFARGQKGRPCVGELSSATWSKQTFQWLAALTANDASSSLAKDLHSIWSTACEEDWPWAKLNRHFMLRVFQGTGMLMASGDDPELHRAGKDFYSQVEKMRPQLSASVSARGQDLVQSGHPLPVSDRSVHRNLFVRDGTGRRSFEAEALPEDTSSLRPGVMLRSPLQDWLFHPVAVVVGPGEQAYLKQLEPVYELVGIERSLLLPRLFATVIPHSFPVEQLRSEDASEPPIDPEQLARRAAEVSEKEVRSILEKDLGINSERAAQLAAGRARRWEKTLRTMFSNELADKVRQQPRKQPEWVFPASGRQERSLSCLTTLAQHGCPLVQAVLDCAEDHLAKGQNNNWQDYLVLVHDPQWNQKSSE